MWHKEIERQTNKETVIEEERLETQKYILVAETEEERLETRKYILVAETGLRL